MASRLLDRLKRSLFKDGQGAGAEQEAGGGREDEEEEEELNEDRWEAELAEEEESVTERLGGTLCFDGGGGGGGAEDGGDGDGSGMDSDSDFLGESMEEGLSSADTSPVSHAPSSLLSRQLQESWRSLRSLGGGGGGGGGSPTSSGRRLTDNLMFEVTDASVVQDGSSKYVLYTVHVIQSGGSDKTPAIITRRYSDFQRLHATLRRNHGDQMERVCFPRKKLRRNFTAETIAKRSRAFEQYLSHLCSLSSLRGAPCVRHFFYLSDLQTGQLLIRSTAMRWRSSHLPLLLLLLSVLALVSGFKICAYNVNKFNNEKAKKFTVLHTLTRVVSHCDICLLQDVRDSDGKVLKALMATLNRYDEYDYNFVASQHLGKSEDDMQKYVFIYKRKMVNVTGQHQSKLTFTREPFVVMFQSSKTLIKDFVLVPLHSDPDQAIEEIDRLYDVFEEIHNMWNNTNVMFLGDFHASCAYVTRSDRKKIRLFTNSSFSWLIKDKMDTTVTDKTHCAYDRIVIHGEHFLKAIEPNTAQIFHFGQMMKLSRSKVLDVSDHYPVEVQLKSSALLLQATPLLVLLGVCTVVRSFLSAL